MPAFPYACAAAWLSLKDPIAASARANVGTDRAQRRRLLLDGHVDASSKQRVRREKAADLASDNRGTKRGLGQRFFSVSVVSCSGVAALVPEGNAGLAQLVEQLICNQ